MHIYLDTEFSERGPAYPLELISAGLVRDDGRTFYAANSAFDPAHANPWVREHVLPYVDAAWKDGRALSLRPDAMAAAIAEFVGTKPVFYGYYADYDWVVLCQLFGTMMDLPKSWPMYCRDLKQMLDEVGNPRVPFEPTQEHDAMADAHWNRRLYAWLMGGTPPMEATHVQPA